MKNDTKKLKKEILMLSKKIDKKNNNMDRNMEQMARLLDSNKNCEEMKDAQYNERELKEKNIKGGRIEIMM